MRATAQRTQMSISASPLQSRSSMNTVRWKPKPKRKRTHHIVYLFNKPRCAGADCNVIIMHALWRAHREWVAQWFVMNVHHNSQSMFFHGALGCIACSLDMLNFDLIMCISCTARQDATFGLSREGKNSLGRPVVSYKL